MFKLHYPAPGSAPATLTRLGEAVFAPAVFHVIEYNLEQVVEHRVETVADLPTANDGRIRWIDMNGLGNLEALQALGEKYGLHPLALEDVLHTGQRPKQEPYDNHLFIVAQMITSGAKESLAGEQVSIFLLHNLLITIQEEPLHDCFEPVRQRIRVGRGNIRKMKADYLAYALLDSIVDHFFPVLEELGESVEAIEDELMNSPNPACVRSLHEHRRTLMQLRRFVWPQRDVASALLHDESGLIQPETKVFLRDCYDHTVQIMDLVESYRDLTSGLLEIYLSSVSMRTNEIMRVLTVISSIFIPLTFVAGVYGMNFDFAGGQMPLNMPELHQPWGYLSCLLVMLGIAVFQLLFFRRKKWF
jgi:magnesium transporter